MSRSQELYTHAKKVIPGGVQLLSKRPEMFCPDQWPNYAAKAKGCEVWDLDGNHYYDMTTNGIGACLLGFADPDVNDAVIRRIQNGSMSTLNAPEEVMLADRLLEILMEEGYLTETKNAKGETVYTIDTEVFEEFGSYYNEDVNVTYDDVTLGQMVIEFESWLFDEDRVANEITYPAAVETDYGQHIMFYYGDSWYCDIADKLANDDYTAFCEGLLEKYGPVEPDMKDWKYISG